MVEFKGKFDENAQKSVEGRSFKTVSKVILIISLVVLIFGIVGVVWGEDAADFQFGIYLIAWAVLFYPLFCGIYFILRKIIKPNTNLMSAETEQLFQFFEDRFICSQVKGEDFNDLLQAKYKVLFKVIETKQQYFLYTTRSQCFVINKADLTNGTIAELNEILIKAMGEKFKKLKK